MRGLWEKGFHFIEGSYYGYYSPESFEEVEDSYEETETEEYSKNYGNDEINELKNYMNNIGNKYDKN